jgi:hypothetical protein
MDETKATLPRISSAAMFKIQIALEEYCSTVRASDLSLHSQRMYQYWAGNFVRWCKGEFNPGSRKGDGLVKQREQVEEVPAKHF